MRLGALVACRSHPLGEVTVGPCATGVRESGQDREVAAFNGAARVPQATWPSPQPAGALSVRALGQTPDQAFGAVGQLGSAKSFHEGAESGRGALPAPLVDAADV